MQIDFHHAVTYVAARLAGFDNARATRIAHAAQYVDDATEETPIQLDNGTRIERVCSSHEMLDPRNIDIYDNAWVWVPFHFLPGNLMRKADDPRPASVIEKSICKTDSPVAQDVIAMMLDSKNLSFADHLLGVVLHVYADTFAHAEFSGLHDAINRIHNVRWMGVGGPSITGWVTAQLDQMIPPIGHGQARELPDLPFLQWEYWDGSRLGVTRDNTAICCRAADAMCRVMQRYRGVAQTGIGKADMDKIRWLFSSLEETDGKARHQAWLNAIASGTFSFGPAVVLYVIGNNKGSWKFDALGTVESLPVYPYRPGVEDSDLARFHQASSYYRSKVLGEILPRYGLNITR